MATLNYTMDANNQVFAGRFNLPSWVRNQAVNTWGEVPLVQTWTDVDPAKDPLVNPNYPNNAPWRAIGGFNARSNAWNGHTAYQGVIYDLPSGGHNDYAGNETYKCDLNSDNPTVVRMTDPSGAIGNEILLDDGLESTGLYSDGKPRTPHNYNSTVFYPPTNQAVLAVLGNGLYKSGQDGTGAAALFDGITMQFQGLTLEAPSGTGTRSPMGSCYDSNRELIWYRGSGTARFATLDPVNNTWESRGNQTALSSAIGFCYIPEHDVIFVTNLAYTNRFAIFDCTTYQYYQPALNGSFVGMSLSGTSQPHYLGDGRIAVWNNSSDTTNINILEFSGDPRSSTFNVTQLPVNINNQVTPTVAGGNGTYGRFQHHDKLGIFTLLNQMNQPLYFYRYK